MFKPALLILAVVSLTFLSTQLWAQKMPTKEHAKHQKSHDADKKVDLAAQLADLRAAMARLEAALEQNHKAKTANGQMPMGMGMGMGMKKQKPMPMGMGMKTKKASMDGGMGMKDKKMGMGMADMKKKKMASMKQSMSAKSSMGVKMMGMGMMGKMGMSAAANMQSVSALPGFPGATHIYHVGATGFFVDHTEHLELTMDQLKSLNTVKGKETLKQSTLSRQLEEREQELWMLTSSDQPEGKEIEAKIREIATLQANKRISFIQAVGRAAKLLTPMQVMRLKGEEQISNPSTSK